MREKFWKLLLRQDDFDYLQAEDNAKGFRDDSHGLLPTLNELAAARPPGRHRARPELRIRINFVGLRRP